MTHNYKTELEKARQELNRLLMDAELIQDQIAKQKRRIAALAELADMAEDSAAPLGLVEGITDAVRTVFRSEGKPLNPAEVRTRVEALGLPPQQNLLASVHTVIRRLLAANEVEEVNPEGGSGPITYRRKSFMSGIKMDKDLLDKALGRGRK